MRRVTASLALAVVGATIAVALAVSGYAVEAMAGLGFIPARIGGLQVPPEVAALPVWLTPLGGTLTQWSLLNAFFGGAVVFWIGSKIEEVLGAAAIILLYVGGAYAAALAYWLVAPDATLPLIGTFSISSTFIGAYAILYGKPKAGGRLLQAFSLLVVWAVVSIAYGLVLGESRGIASIAAAYFGGFLFGLTLALPLLRWRWRAA